MACAEISACIKATFLHIVVVIVVLGGLLIIGLSELGFVELSKNTATALFGFIQMAFGAGIEAWKTEQGLANEE